MLPSPAPELYVSLASSFNIHVFFFVSFWIFEVIQFCAEVSIYPNFLLSLWLRLYFLKIVDSIFFPDSLVCGTDDFHYQRLSFSHDSLISTTIAYRSPDSYCRSSRFFVCVCVCVVREGLPLGEGWSTLLPQSRRLQYVVEVLRFLQLPQ